MNNNEIGPNEDQEFVAPITGYAETGKEMESSPTIDKAVEALGFVETPELLELKGQVVENLRIGNNEAAEQSWSKYCDLGEALADGTEGAQGRLGLAIAKALIFREAGLFDDYRMELGAMDIQDIPENALPDNIRQLIQRELNEEV